MLGEIFWLLVVKGKGKEKKYSVLCRLREALDLKEPTPCTFCKQGKQTYRKNLKAHPMYICQKLLSH